MKGMDTHTLSVATASRAVDRLIFRTRSRTRSLASMMDVDATVDFERVKLQGVEVLGTPAALIVEVERAILEEGERREGKRKWEEGEGGGQVFKEHVGE